MSRVRRRGVLRIVLLVFAWGVATMLMLVIPDYCVLMGVAHTPIILIWTSFGWPPGGSILDASYWPVVNQFARIAGGLLWVATAVAYGRTLPPVLTFGGMSLHR
jgi:hypothetical protein